MSYLDDLLEAERLRKESQPVATDTYLDAALREEKRREADAKQSVFEQYGNNPWNMGWAAFKNLPQSATGLVSDMLSVGEDPIGAAKAVGETAQAAANKGARKLVEMQTGQELEPMEEHSEFAADLVGEEINRRYGSVENAARTAIEDPAGFGMDASIIGSVLPKASRVAKIVNRLDPMTAASNAVDRIVTNAAKAEYGNAAGIPRTIGIDERAALIDRGMDVSGDFGGALNPTSGIGVSDRGIIKAKVGKKQAGKDIDRIISSYGDDMDLPVSDINRNLNELMKSYEGVSGGNEAIEVVRKFQGRLLDEFVFRKPDSSPHRYRDGELVRQDFINPRQLQKFKTDVWQQVYKREAESPMRGEKPKTKTLKSQGAAARQTLEDIFPDLKEANINWAEHAQLKPMLERAVDRFAQSEQWTDIIPFIGKQARNPRWRARMAIAARKAADGDIKWLENNLPSRDIRIALVMAGRNLQTLNQEENRPMPSLYAPR